MTNHPADRIALPLQIDSVRDTLARNLSTARAALGLSQDEVAAKGGVSRATINQLEGAEGDPRLSTLVGIAVALGVSPIFLLLGRDELNALLQAPSSEEAKAIQAHLTSEELETMRRLLQSGIAKNRTKALAMGTSVASGLGLNAKTIAAAAIGTSLLPGIGTAIGAAFAITWLALKNNDKSNSE
jgi:transcriptional regulator with XRE-family HTH domain